mgnify:CR=1 FL=1
MPSAIMRMQSDEDLDFDLEFDFDFEGVGCTPIVGGEQLELGGADVADLDKELDDMLTDAGQERATADLVERKSHIEMGLVSKKKTAAEIKKEKAYAKAGEVDFKVLEQELEELDMDVDLDDLLGKQGSQSAPWASDLDAELDLDDLVGKQGCQSVPEPSYSESLADFLEDGEEGWARQTIHEK